MNPTKGGRYEIVNWADICTIAEWLDGSWWIHTSLGLEKTYIKRWRKCPKCKWIEAQQ